MENNKYYRDELPENNPVFELDRRNFVKLLGGGLFIYFQLGELLTGLATETEQRRSLPTDYNAFLHIGEDGKVTAMVGKIEMGQGIITSFPQMIADELDTPLESIKMVMGDTELCPYDAGTWGSLSTRVLGPSLLAAVAEARSVLLTMGAEYLGTKPEELAIENGIIYVKNNKSKKVSYGQLTKGRKIEKYLDVKPKTKDFSEYKIRGKSFRHADGVAKVTGEAMYSGDFRMPGMLYAKILRPPSHGATLVSADTSEAEKLEGIVIARDKDLVAVLHKDPEKAEAALAKVKAEYKFDEMKVDDKTIFKHLLEIPSEARVIKSAGDVESGKKNAELIFESEFYNSYVAHSPMEPHTALAYLEGDQMILRASTQTPFGTQDGVSRELGVELDKVRVIPPFLGGGFGGKSAFPQAVEAARLAKLTGKPVMVQWTRKEEFFYDTFRPAAVVKITSGVSKSGKISVWDFHEYFAGPRGSDTIYDVPDSKTTSYSARDAHPFGTGAWRAPANNTNTFARESQIDRMAVKLGADPVDFRLKNLKDERMLGVLKAVAELWGWKPAKGPSGRGYGIACGFDAGSYVAHIAEVKVDQKTGKVKVIRVACAQDMGFCINPEGSIIQMEGCIIMGMGYALTEEVMFTGGDIHTADYGTYQIPLFSWVPKIQTKILDKNEAPQGGGEPAIICMGAVIANAIFDATGARLYQLPMTPARVMEAIAKAK
ncbi:MAG: molybdopterin-dependent oxidoreductase [Bacteroidota bacterium]|nr:molybdopterin-dependent oxidoreductase [Bacteroidota bacterium]